jgi:hypothetical protein
MKQLLYAFSSICMVSCSPKLQPEIRTALPDNTFVVVLEPGDHFNYNDAIGTISASDDASLKQTARSRGANLIKITAYKKADHTISAKIYKVDNPKLYETKFEWSSNRTLSWEDYKGRPAPDRDTNIAATTSCRFGLVVNPSGSGEVAVTNEFICHQSSVRPGQQQPALLAHEQLHFDLCEVYARMLRKELAETARTSQDVNDAFIKTYKLYKERQWLYDEETNHGLEPQAQERWQHSIMEELRTFAAYAR